MIKALCILPALVLLGMLAAADAQQQALLDSPVPVGRLADTEGSNELLLDSAQHVDTFTAGGSTYAAVTSFADHGLQIVDVTDPASPTATGNLADTFSLLLNGARDVRIFETGNGTYAAVASSNDSGLQLVDVTDPASPTAAGQLRDNGSRLLRGAYSVATFAAGGSAYAAVTSPFDHGLQIVDVTDPDNPTAAGHLGDAEDPNGLLLREAFGVDTFAAGGSTYAAVASPAEGLQIVDVTDPDNPTAAGQLRDNASRRLNGAQHVDTFAAGGSTYAAVASFADHGLQIVDVTDPDNPTAAGQLGDNGSRLLRGATGVDTFVIGNGTYAAVASQNEDGLQIVRLAEADTTAPALVAGELVNATGVITVQFDEVIDVSEMDLDDMYIYETDDINLGFSLGGNSVVNSTSDSRTLVVTLNAATLHYVSGAWIRNGDGVTVYFEPGNVIDLHGNANTENLSLQVFPVIHPVEFDTEPPVITLRGANPLRHELGDAYADPGAAADDGSAVVTNSAAVDVDRRGDYTVTYTATDSSNNTGTATRTVQVRDTTKPVITLNGNPSTTLELGGTYAEQGAAVSDNDPAYAVTEATVGGDAVDASAAGAYTVTYTAPADGAGNAPDPVSRTVTVRDTTPPSLVSAAYDEGTGILTAVFDEVIDISRTDTGYVYVEDDNGHTAGMSIDLTAPDSDVLTFQLGDSGLSGLVNPALVVDPDGIWDVAGNEASWKFVPITIIPATPEPPPTPPTEPPSSACEPPSSGDWHVRDSCLLGSDTRVPAGITIHAPAMLYISSGVTLDVDFANHGLLIKEGAGLLIQHGGGMR